MALRPARNEAFFERFVGERDNDGADEVHIGLLARIDAALREPHRGYRIGCDAQRAGGRSAERRIGIGSGGEGVERHAQVRNLDHRHNRPTALRAASMPLVQAQ